MNVGYRIRLRLVELAMSEGDLARQMGVTPSAVSRLLGKRHCHTRTVARLAAVLGISPEYLLRDDGAEMEDRR